MKKIVKRLISVLAAATVLTAFAPTASADVPYRSYNYNSYGEAVESANIYEPYLVLSGEKINAGGFIAPNDVFVKGDILYILDSGNNRIVKYGLTDKAVSEYLVSDNGNSVELNKATGIYVDDGGTVYIADSGNQCVWVCGADGAVKAQVTKPETEYFQEGLEFLPRKVVGDAVGNIYVQCTGVYEGLVIFDSELDFSGFFGSEKVQTTAQLLRNYFWKQFMTGEQKEAMANYVPSEIYSMDMSADNFLYTITPGSLVSGLSYKQSADSIRCLNPKGSDILESFMSKDVSRAFDNENRYLNFIDICYSESGFINVIDNKQGRIYQFDNNMQLVSAFGGVGDYTGTFQQPIAVESYGDDILVLDSIKNTVTFFSLTKTGETVHRALTLYNDGNYTASIEPWYEVMEANPNFQLAYIGVGNALFNEGEYKRAMEYYEIARDTTGYSNAYREYRVMFMRENFIWIALLLVAVCVIFKAFKAILNKKGIFLSKRLYATDFGMVLYSSFHPMVGFDRLRTRKIKSNAFLVFVYLLLVLLGVCEQQYMGKAFVIIDSSEVNIISVALVRLALLLLFVVANWAFSELMTGKATFSQICTFTAASLMPYIISGFIRVIMSRFLVENEAVFMSVVLSVGIICSFVVLMVAFAVFHEFELGKSLFSFVATAIGMLLIVVLVFLIYNLTQNVIDFIKTLFSELMFRINS
ncbi:MAG: hypothetical protein IKD04_00575 [Clostridia bacterium]|nr:hypothetical protein [Clostridia bacterium]